MADKSKTTTHPDLQLIINELSTTTEDNREWWQREAEFEKAKHILIGTVVSYVNPDGNVEIGTVVDAVIQKPVRLHGRYISPRIVLRVILRELGGHREHCRCGEMSNFSPIDPAGLTKQYFELYQRMITKS